MTLCGVTLITLRSAYDIGRPSVVCDVRAPYTEGWTFRQYFTPSNSLGTRAVCVKILEEIREVLGGREVKLLKLVKLL